MSDEAFDKNIDNPSHEPYFAPPQSETVNILIGVDSIRSSFSTLTRDIKLDEERDPKSW